MSNRQPPTNDELEVAEAKNPLVDLLYDYTAQALMSRIGNYVYNRFDAGLAIIEKTAKWSLPQPPPSEEDTSKTTISAPPLIRPLPWILFLPALIALRMIRYGLSLIALLIGKQPVYPITMVNFIQNRRRKLRALKYRGLKLQRMQRADKEAKPKAKKQPADTWLRRITLPLRYMICLKALATETTSNQRDHHHHHHHRHHPKRSSEKSREMSEEPTTNGSHRADPTTKKRNVHERDADDSESSFDEATIQELLEKYANAEADSSFHPSDVSSSNSESYIFESDKSHTEATEDTKKNDTQKIKNESNGHAASNGQEPESKTETSQKSSLNASLKNGKPEEKPVEPGPENGNVDSKKEQKVPFTEENPTEAPQKPSAAENERKPANQSNPIKGPPEDASLKNDNHNSSNKQSPSSMKEVKSGFHQRNKQQHQPQPNQQQQQHQPQANQQQQQHQQHYAAVNGGGGGRKHKKLNHQNAQHN